MYGLGLLASDMKVNLLGGGLVVLGMVLLVVTLAFWRAAGEDPEVLAPLEVMADRRFSRANAGRRLAMLDKVRPDSGSVDPQEPVWSPVAEPTEREPRAERASNPRVVRRLRVPAEPQSTGVIDPLLSPRFPKE